MPDDKMIFGIEFQTNAKKTAQDIKELEKDVKNLEKQGQKRTISDVGKLNATQKQVKADIKETKEKERQNKLAIKSEKERKKQEKEQAKAFKLRKKQVETEYKIQKQIEQTERKRLNNTKQLVSLIASAVSTGSVIKFTANAIQEGRNYDIASQNVLYDPETINALALMAKKFGGDLSTVTNAISKIRSELLQFAKWGLSSASMEAVYAKFGNVGDKIYRDKNGNPITDPLTFLVNVAKVMSNMPKEMALELGDTIGLDRAFTNLLIENGSNLAENLKETKKHVAFNAENTKKLSAQAQNWEEIKNGFTKFWTDVAKWLPDFGPEVNSKIGYWGGAIVAGLGVVTAAILAKRAYDWFRGGKGFGKGQGKGFGNGTPQNTGKGFGNGNGKGTGKGTGNGTPQWMKNLQKKYGTGKGTPQNTGNGTGKGFWDKIQKGAIKHAFKEIMTKVSAFAGTEAAASLGVGAFFATALAMFGAMAISKRNELEEEAKRKSFNVTVYGNEHGIPFNGNLANMTNTAFNYATPQALYGEYANQTTSSTTTNNNEFNVTFNGVNMNDADEIMRRFNGSVFEIFQTSNLK